MNLEEIKGLENLNASSNMRATTLGMAIFHTPKLEVHQNYTLHPACIIICIGTLIYEGFWDEEFSCVYNLHFHL